MSELTPTRSAVIALKEERRSMQEGYVFLDEKCLILAGEMLRELRRFDAAMAGLRERQRAALAALSAAILRHGLQGLQCYPAPEPAAAKVRTARRSLLGVLVCEAELERTEARLPAPVLASPEAEGCRMRFVAVVEQLARLAAMAGNLERLHREYRRSVRRVRALQDVLLPELDRTVSGIESRLEELEQDEALWVRSRR
jgi:V/A-type H+-transporting ATPase subunit D